MTVTALPLTESGLAQFLSYLGKPDGPLTVTIPLSKEKQHIVEALADWAVGHGWVRRASINWELVPSGSEEVMDLVMVGSAPGVARMVLALDRRLAGRPWEEI